MFLQAWVHWHLKTVQTTAKNIRGQVHETVLQCKAKFGRNPRTNPYSRNAMTAKFWVAHDKILWQLPKYLINIFQSTRPPTSLGYFAATSKVEGTSSLFLPKRLRTMCWSMSESVRMTGYQRKSQLCWSTASSRVLLPNVQVAVDIYLYASGGSQSVASNLGHLLHMSLIMFFTRRSFFTMPNSQHGGNAFSFTGIIPCKYPIGSNKIGNTGRFFLTWASVTSMLHDFTLAMLISFRDTGSLKENVASFGVCECRFY